MNLYIMAAIYIIVISGTLWSLISTRQWYELEYDLWNITKPHIPRYLSLPITPSIITYDFGNHIDKKSSRVPIFDYRKFMRRGLWIIIGSPIILLVLPVFIGISFTINGPRISRGIRGLPEIFKNDFYSMRCVKQSLRKKIKIKQDRNQRLNILSKSYSKIDSLDKI